MYKIVDKYTSMIEDVKAVLFDLDGSLMDSMWMWKKIDIEYLESFGKECPTHLQSDVEGKSIVEVAEYFRKELKIDISVNEMIDDWSRMAFDKYSNEVEPKKGALEFLEYLRAKDIKMGICSSNSQKLIFAVLDAYNIRDYFGVIVTGQDVKCGKPNPECYLKAADTLNVSPSECLVVEDLLVGIRAGHNAGMKVVTIKDEHSEYQWKDKVAMADYAITDYTDLFE